MSVLFFGAPRMLEEEGRVNAWIKASIHLETSTANTTYAKINAFSSIMQTYYTPKLSSIIYVGYLEYAV